MCIHGRYASACDNRVIKSLISVFIWTMRNNGHIFSCNMDAVVHRVEWVTLIFFGSMFITMECLSRLGLITWIGKQTEYLILLGEERFRLFFAIIIILCVKIVYSKVLETYLILFIRNVQFSALSSSVVDSTRVTAMMVKVFRFFRSKHRVFSLFVQLKSKLCE